MEPLLFLAHRIPYPPNKGDKIRSFHFLKCLASRFAVYLGTFIDDPDDVAHVESLRPYCAEIHAVRLSPPLRRLASLRGFLSGEALSLPYYANASMRRWVRRTSARHRPRVAFAYSSTMAQYLVDGTAAAQRRIVDFVDVDSAKWRAYAATRPWPMSAVYAREGKRLLDFERRVAATVDNCVFVSEAESALFESLLEAPSAKVCFVNNGVDLEYFEPARVAAGSPYPVDRKAVVFTGAMDYWANVDAVVWFAEAVLPRLRARAPETEFWIVGANPLPTVRELAARPGVHVTGKVADVRPYLKHARCAVAPMRIARGIQNKVLEAMAMARPVVGTTAAFEGLAVGEALRPLITDDPEQMAERCAECLEEAPAAALGAAGRAYVAANHDWRSSYERLQALVA